VMHAGEKMAMNETRKFGLALAIVLAALAGVQVLRSHTTAASWLAACAVIALVLTVFAPRALAPVSKVLTAIARAIGWVNTHLILALAFYLVFTPVGLVARLLRKDLLRIRFRSAEDSYWIPYEPKVFRKEDYTRQF
jgi:hypothetical protein